MSKRKYWKIDSTRKRILNEITSIVTVYSYPDEDYCPDCKYDPVSKSSVDMNCETCNGTGKVLGSPNVTRFRGNLRQLQGESIVRRNLGNVTSDLYLLYCSADMLSILQEAKHIKIKDNYYEAWLDDTSNPVIKYIRTMDKQDRIEITLKRREGEDS